MSDKQTRCPNCSTLYKITVTQLTVAQGMVCCPKCLHNFNALTQLIHIEQPAVDLLQKAEEKSLPVELPQQQEYHILDIFDRKIENSNIDLRTYLNNINYFNNDPLMELPTLNLSSGFKQPLDRSKKKPNSYIYYGVWSTINLVLILILGFQILWFNPNLLDRSPKLNAIFIQTCSILRCTTINQQYLQIKIHNLKVETVEDHLHFSGQLLNHLETSLELPLIKVTLFSNGRTQHTFILTANQYLVSNLTGIERIPQNSPFRFDFSVETSQKDFDDYKIEIIHP